MVALGSMPLSETMLENYNATFARDRDLSEGASEALVYTIWSSLDEAASAEWPQTKRLAVDALRWGRTPPVGDTLRGQKRFNEAVAAYREGAGEAASSLELRRRCLLEEGKTYDLMREHDKAVQQYEAVLNTGGDTAQGDQARKYMKSAYNGKP